jgi:hypothetical protein
MELYCKLARQKLPACNPALASQFYTIFLGLLQGHAQLSQSEDAGPCPEFIITMTEVQASITAAWGATLDDTPLGKVYVGVILPPAGR